MNPTEVNPLPLAGRRAVVTGGASGLGRAIAERLAEAGAAITIIDLDEALQSAAPPAGWAVEAIDLAAPDAEPRLAAVAERLGALDVLVANAGVVPPWRRIAALDREEWRRVFDVNVWGAAVSMKAFAGALAKSGRGSAVLMASINGYRAHPDQTLYTATKHAVIGLTRAAALDFGRDGVRVNAVAPGPVATDALLDRIETRANAGGSSAADALAALAAETALGRMATPRMVADVALFLASDQSAGMTGAVLPVESGLA